MTIGELSRRTGLAVRTLRFYADAGVLPEAGRTEAGYRVFDAEAVARARLVRTLRELDAQIATLHVQRSVLRLVATNPEGLETMDDLITTTAEERRRILDDYLDAVFGDAPDAVGDRYRMGTPELPEDPTPEQAAAWVELAALLRDPDYVARSKAMADRARAEGPEPDPAQFEVGKAVNEHAGAAVRAGADPASAAGLAVVEALEALGGGAKEPRAAAAERIEAFTDRRVARYWSLVAIINGWPRDQAAEPDAMGDAWEWYGRALRAHAG